MPASLRVETIGGVVRVLTLVNAGKKNALDATGLDALDEALSDDRGVRAWVLRGDGDAFCAGYDLHALAAFDYSRALPDERLGEVLAKLSTHPAPSVAMVRGVAFGAGCELALACDFRVGDETSVFCMPPALVGVVYALDGLTRVIDKVGAHTARVMFLTGRRLGAIEALERGLLDEQAPAAQLEAQSVTLARALAANAPLAVAGLKRGFELALRGATDAERADYEVRRRQSFTSRDAQEGRAAILEKRRPVFRGE